MLQSIKGVVPRTVKSERTTPRPGKRYKVLTPTWHTAPFSNYIFHFPPLVAATASLVIAPISNTDYNE